MIREKRPISWMLCNPYQGFWNWDLVGLIQKIVPIVFVRKVLIRAVIYLDTGVLFLKAYLSRIFLLGPSTVFSKAVVPENIPFLYLDLGTHKEGAEIDLVLNHILPEICSSFKIYGFEANGESFQSVSDKFSKNKNVKIIRKALCYAPPAGGLIRLYKDGREGGADSLYRKTDSYEEVEAVRLSDFLRENTIMTEAKIVILRMNIEGAEQDVLKDLVESGFSESIHGYFGMWDDVSKISVCQDVEFRSFLKKNRIKNFTFNGRDLNWPLRVKCIKYVMHTCVLQALRAQSFGEIPG